MRPSTVVGVVGIVWYAAYLLLVVGVTPTLTMQCFCIYVGTMVPLGFFLIAGYIRFYGYDHYIQKRIDQHKRERAYRDNSKKKSK